MKKALVLMLSLIMLTGCTTTRTEPTVTATPESAVAATPDTGHRRLPRCLNLPWLTPRQPTRGKRKR